MKLLHRLNPFHKCWYKGGSTDADYSHCLHCGQWWHSKIVYWCGYGFRESNKCKRPKYLKGVKNDK